MFARVVAVSFVLIFFILFFQSYIFSESTAPVMESSAPTHWNLQNDIMLDFYDESGIRGYSIEIFIENQSIYKTSDVALNKPKRLSIPLPRPPTQLKNGTILQYKISVTDFSNAAFFTGNTLTESVNIVLDTQAPEVQILAHSPKIQRSGSALVLFKVNDLGLDSVSVSNGKDTFRVFKFNFDGIKLDEYETLYGGVVAWPLHNTFFEGSIIVKDKANNLTKIPLQIVKNLSSPLRISNINIRDEFLSKKLDEIINALDDQNIKRIKGNLDRFLYLNTELRKQSFERIYRASSKGVSDYFFTHITPFAPIENARIDGFFADKRNYMYNKEQVATSYHMGVDLISIKNAPIYLSNRGAVAINSYLPIHGNTIMLYHGFGLYSLYAHANKSWVSVGDDVQIGAVIGSTGSTGWSFGDHLHFEILVQGHSVNPNEWMSAKWVEENINGVLNLAKDKLRTR